jgi:ABC-type multidrug transport system fused ATPase/permease subunit
MLGLIGTQLLAPWPLKIIFDHILLDKAPPPVLSWLDGLSPVPALVAVSASIVLLALLSALFSYLQHFLTARAGHRMVYAIRRELFAHLQRLSLSFHNRTRSGELMARMAVDTNALRNVFTESALMFAGDILTVVGMVAVMLALDWKLGAIVLAAFPILLGTFFFRFRTIRASVSRQRQNEGRIAVQMTEVLGAVPLVQAFGRESHEAERFEAESAASREEGIRTARLEAAATRAVEMTRALGTAAVVLFGSIEVLAGRMTLGTVLVFVSYLNHLYRPIRNLAKLSRTLARASVSAERIGGVLDQEPEIQDAPDAIEASGRAGAIAFDNVSFDYGDGHPVLKDLTFSISPGQRVAIVGASGAGKSTLSALILRFYDPTAGSISIDGVDLRKYRCKSLRREIGIVLQDSLLLGSTIRENIRYGKVDATAEEIEAAARAAHADEFIRKLKEGYDSVVGERGARLSGGQQRRLGIARALIRNAPILILDEPMSGLDVESEAKVRVALANLMAGKTCILITHDLGATIDADLILVLEDGRIVERGNHRELMARSERYSRLFEMKSGRRGRAAVGKELPLDTEDYRYAEGKP